MLTCNAIFEKNVHNYFFFVRYALISILEMRRQKVTERKRKKHSHKFVCLFFMKLFFILSLKKLTAKLNTSQSPVL
jgi:hypothetical protein